MSPAEAALWLGLKGRRFHGRLFRRQHPVGPYLLDFYCDALKLCVEVDGRWHDHPERMAADARRDAFLSARGIRTVRVGAHAVLSDVDAVLRWLSMELELTAPSVGFADTSPATAGEDEVE